MPPDATSSPFLGSPSPVAAAILAGGQARRMGGGDKGRTIVGGEDVLTRTVRVLRPQAALLAVNANGDAARFADLGCPVWPDVIPDAGPLSGLAAALEHAAGAGFAWLLSVPTDTPFLPADLVLRLGLAMGRGDAAIAASGGRRHPTVGLWSTALAEPLRRFVLEEGERRAGAWAARAGAAQAEWAAEPVDPFANVNDASDLAQARALVESGSFPMPGAVVVSSGEEGRRLLAGFVARIRAGGASPGGLLQLGGRETAADEIELVALDGEERFPIMRRFAPTADCAVDVSEVAGATRILRRALDRRRAPVIVNKFGPLEADRHGLLDEMMAIAAAGLPLLTTLAAERVPAWLAVTGGWCELLPPEPAALDAWWDRHRPRG